MEKYMARHVAVNGKPDKSALEMIEEATRLIRSFPADLWIWYYLGTLPFCLGLLYFTADMSLKAYSKEYCLATSLGMAILFIWMKCMQSVFAIKAYEFLGRLTLGAWSVRSAARLVLCQTLLQVSGWIILPLALLATIPFAWTYAMYQMGLVCDTRKKADVRALAASCFKIGRGYSKMNHLVIAILGLFGCFVFLNIAVLVYQLPHLVKMLTSIENPFTMGGFNMFNSTFLLIVCCLTYLCVDPLIKTIFILEKFYGDSIESGTDLMARLNQVVKNTGSKIIVAGIAGVLIITIPLAGDAGSNQKPRPSVDSEILAQSIETTLQQREYAWRLPGEKVSEPGTGFVTSLLNWVIPYIRSIGRTVWSSIKSIWEFFKKLFPAIKAPLDLEHGKTEPESPGWIFFILMGIAGIFWLFLWRLNRKKRKGSRKEIPETILVDVSDERVTPGDLPYDRWIALANNLMEKGDFRLAVRALYLGTLSCLSDRHFIEIAAYKSNREYESELTRRAHTREDLVQGFVNTVRFFDRVWYGLYPVERQDVITFASHQKRIRSFVQ